MSAAAQLFGLDLPNNWKVIAPVPRSAAGTGGHFSHSYIVEKSEATNNGGLVKTRGFLKAFDFSDAFEPGVDTIQELQNLTNAYEHEREVLEHCAGRRLANVVLAIDHGHVQVPGMNIIEGRVFYLIFEMADGDVRIQMDKSTACDSVWCMHALRQICLGLWQVHREMIAHQDTKPSNVLAYGGSTFKIADFGCSSRKGITSPRDKLNIAGDRTYSPPELLYGYTDPDFVARRIGCDLYMFGNLAAFLFSGTNVTASLKRHLDPQHHHRNWNGTYEEVLPYVSAAFSRVISDLNSVIEADVAKDVIPLIQELCHPDIRRRGHPRGIGRRDQYSLERYVSRLDRIVRELEVRTRIQRNQR